MDLVTFNVSISQRRQLRSSTAASALSFQQELSSIDALFQSADQTFGTVSLLISDLLTHTVPSDVP